MPVLTGSRTATLLLAAVACIAALGAIACLFVLAVFPSTEGAPRARIPGLIPFIKVQTILVVCLSAAGVAFVTLGVRRRH